MRDERKLEDLAGVGKAALADFKLLGIHTVEQLAQKDG
jgi:nucleotidyltransferase/DNA polymerase involved in DNA repair